MFLLVFRQTKIHEGLIVLPIFTPHLSFSLYVLNQHAGFLCFFCTWFKMTTKVGFYDRVAHFVYLIVCQILVAICGLFAVLKMLLFRVLWTP
jgi:hypothetical protein